jgi:hypothetical protein
VRDLEDVGQSSDGKQRAASLRTAQVGYDLIFLIGNRTWTDYEAAAPVTILDMSARTGNVKHVGLCLRWAGYSIDNKQVEDQPKWGLHARLADHYEETIATRAAVLSRRFGRLSASAGQPR